MKSNYEGRTKQLLPRRTYTIIRLDGKAFHTFTRGMKKPFDTNFINTMDQTAMFLCEEIQGCQLAYIQSDEISLLLSDFNKITSDAWFDGNVQKICSVAASLATGKFNKIRTLDVMNIGTSESSDIETFIMNSLDDMTLAFFDARVFIIPDPVEVENYFVWRQKDAVRNSISMTAQNLYSHKELQGKSTSEMQELCYQKGVNWNDQPDGFKRGRMIVKHDFVETTEFNWNIVDAIDILKIEISSVK